MTNTLATVRNDDSVVDPKHAYNQVSWERECNLITTWADLVEQIPDNDDYGRHLSVALISRVFDMIRLRIAANYSLLNARVDEATEAIAIAKTLSRVVRSLRWTLDQSRLDCGAYTSLPWVADIAQCYEAAKSSRNPHGWDPLQTVAITGDRTIEDNVARIVDLFKACADLHLLTSTTITADLAKLLDLLKLQADSTSRTPGQAQASADDEAVAMHEDTLQSEFSVGSYSTISVAPSLITYKAYATAGVQDDRIWYASSSQPHTTEGTRPSTDGDFEPHQPPVSISIHQPQS